MLSEVRQSIRSLRNAPAFAFTTVAVLALGIGANTAIFSVLNSVLLHPAGIYDPHRIAVVRAKYDKLNLKNISVSAPDYADARDAKQVFSAVTALSAEDYNYTGSDTPVRLQGAQVTWQFFDVFGTRPEIGRAFRADEDAPNMNRVVVLSHATWQNLFGGDRGLVGRDIQLNGISYRVIGVMPAGFRFPGTAELWTPLAIAPERFNPESNRGNEWLFAAGRLQPGVSQEQASAAMRVLTEQIIQREDKDGGARNVGWGMLTVPYLAFSAGDSRTPMLILMGAVGFVLLIACSNVAGLMLARASHRAREYSIRAALGASRWTIMRQSLAESLCLSLAGGAIGLLLGLVGSKLLVALAPGQMAETVIVRMDPYVVLFAVGATALSAILFGIVPAIQVSRADHQLALREGGRGGTSSKARQRLRSALVVAEFALALILMVGAGLLIRSLAQLHGVDTGFDPRGVMTAQLTLPRTTYKEPEKQAAFYRATVEKLRSLPGVQHAAAVIPMPFSGNNWAGSFNITRHPTAPGAPSPHGDQRRVTPDYFATMGIDLLRGRLFTESDREGTEPVVVIDDLLAKQYWPNEDPIGQQVHRDPKKPFTIIGIVRHVRHSELVGEEKKGAYYFSMYQDPVPLTALVLRTSGDPAMLAGAIREAVRQVDPAQPVHSLKTMKDLVDASLATKRLAVILLGIFAAFALALSAIGIYGVVSYSVAQRTAEIGIRVALGASGQNVLGMILKQGAALALLGVGIGLAGAAVVTRLLRGQLFQVSAFDPATFAGMAAMLAAIALLATYLPARRALRIAPSEALRYE